MSTVANLSLVEVEEIEDASHIFIEERVLGQKLKENKLYELHKEKYRTYDYDGEVTLDQHYIINEEGNKDYGVLLISSCKLFKLVMN